MLIWVCSQRSNSIEISSRPSRAVAQRHGGSGAATAERRQWQCSGGGSGNGRSVDGRCAACLLSLAVVIVPPAVVLPVTVVVPPLANVPPVALLPLAEDKDVRRADVRDGRTAARWERRLLIAAAAAWGRDDYYYINMVSGKVL